MICELGLAEVQSSLVIAFSSLQTWISTLVSGWYELKPVEKYDIQETADSDVCP